MRKIKEVLQLRRELGLGRRQTGRICPISHNTVAEYEQRTQAAGLSWPLPEHLDDQALAALLFPSWIFRLKRPPCPDGGANQSGQMFQRFRCIVREIVTLQYVEIIFRKAIKEGGRKEGKAGKKERLIFLVLLPISWSKGVEDSRGQGFKGLFSKDFINAWRALN